MNLSEIVQNVNAELLPATNIDTYIKRWVNQAQKRFISTAGSHVFSWLILNELQLTTVANQHEYVLSPLINTNKAVTFTDRVNDRKIEVISRQTFQKFVPDPTETSGNPEFAYWSGFSAVQEQPSSASQLSIVSSAADSATITIEGLNSGGALVYEEVTLNGTTPVSTTISFQKILSRGINGYLTGVVTITSNSGAVTVDTISPRSRQAQYPKVIFYPRPDSVQTLYYDAEMKLPDVVNNNDFSLIPEEFHDALEEYCLYRGFRHKKDLQSSELALNKFKERVMEAVRFDKRNGKKIVMQSYYPTTDIGSPQLPSNFPRSF